MRPLATLDTYMDSDRGRVWVQHQGETRRFALKGNKLDVGKLAKFWKLDIETISIGPDPVEFNEHGLSVLTIEEIRRLASDDFVECGDGRLKTSPFKIQAVQAGVGPNLGGPNTTANPTQSAQNTAATPKVFSRVFASRPIKHELPSVSSLLHPIPKFPKPNSDRSLRADGITNEVIRMMQSTADTNRVITNASLNAMQEITRRRTENLLLQAKGKHILGNLNKF